MLYHQLRGLFVVALTLAPIFAAEAASPFDWTGFYLGANAGYGLGRKPAALDGLPGFAIGQRIYLQPHGSLGGLQTGYNWQNGNWVFGTEADFQWTDQDTRICIGVCGPLFRIPIEQRLPWFATVRGRIGYASGPLLFYYTGGVAFGEEKTRINETNVNQAGDFRFDQSKTGWTIGSGVEAAVGGHWTAKIEYLYVDFGRVSCGYIFDGTAHTYHNDIHDHIFRAGLNYHFGPATSAQALMPAPMLEWAGLYLGVNFGHAVTRDATSLGNAITGPETLDLAPAGWLGGIQGGYNWRNGNWITGIETDLQFGAQSDSRTCIFACISNQYAKFDQSLPWFGTARARAGYAFGPSLIYATGGLAYGEIRTKVEDFLTGTLGNYTFSHTKVGWTAGGGFETAAPFWKNWTIKTEYLFVDLGGVTDTFTKADFAGTRVLKTEAHNHVFRTGLNYKFGSQ